MRKTILLGSAVAVVLLASLVYWNSRGQSGSPRYRLAQVERGAILTTVSSTGRINPISSVEVGSQVSGQILQVSADFNTRVKKGQVIARLDPASFEARLRAARAETAVAEAGVVMQRAGIAELNADLAGGRAALSAAEKDLKRKRAFVKKKLAPQSEFDNALSTRDQAKARLDRIFALLEKQRAQIVMALAQVKARAAVLRDRELELENTVIRSPVAGVVIARNVDPGQTVAASLQAPVLFTIAESLERMQLEVSVDEADIGRVRVGQSARFTVDAFPRRRFHGKVSQIRKAPLIVSNVVTYTVVADASNRENLLLPGMTANVEIVIGERREALKVPDAALRFRPAGAGAEGAGGAGAAGGGGSGGGGRRAANRERFRRLVETLKLNEQQQRQAREIFRETGQAIRAQRQNGTGGEDLREVVRQLRAQANNRIAALLDAGQRAGFEQLRAAAGSRRPGRLWVLDEQGQPGPVNVVLGISDGTMTEIVSGAVEAGTSVVVGLADPAAAR